MKSKVKITSAIIAIILAMAISPIYAQWGFKIGEEMKIPSADAWNFVKQGEVGANLHTGTISLSIPVYTYKDNDFTIPVSLNYSSNGFVANIRPGLLGPDWTLQAGGCISVEIRGMSDFKSENYASSYYQYHLLSNPGTEGSYWRYSNYADQNIELGASAPEIIYIPQPGMNIFNNTPKYDAEPDFFHFNFMGYSGTFCMGPENIIYVYNTNGDNKLLKVNFRNTSGSSFDILITDKNGYLYEFLDIDTDKAADRTGDAKLRVAYKLSQITAPNGRTVKFNYDNSYDMTSYRPATFANTGGVFDMGDDGNPVTGTNYSDNRVLESVLEASILTDICIGDDKIIEFGYKTLAAGTRDQYVKNIGNTLYEFADCRRLSSIKVLNPYDNNTILKQADMTYTCTASPRINFLSSVTIKGEGTYSFAYYNVPNGSFPPLGTLSADHWGYYNGKSVSNFLKIVSTNTGTLDETISSTDRNPDATHAIKGMIQKVTYPTGGYSQLEYETHSYSKAFSRNSSNSFSPVLVSETGTCGGLRIKSVSNYSETGTLLNKSIYNYTLDDGSSSGILLHLPKYWINYSAFAGSHIESNINYWSNNLLSHNGSHIEYSRVTQVNSDNSREVFHFSNSARSETYRDGLHFSIIANEVTPLQGEWAITSNSMVRRIVAPIISKRAERGKLLKHETFNAGESMPVKVISYQYDTARFLGIHTFPTYLIRAFGENMVFTDNYRLISKSETQKNGTASITRTETYTYNAKGQLGSVTTTASNNAKQITRYTYTTDHLAEGGIFTTMDSRNLLDYPVTETRHIVENGIEKQIWGKKYSYALLNNMVKPATMYNYNTSDGTWEVEQLYTQYDQLGNLIESYDSNNIPTSYIWGYGGKYMVGIVENAPRSALSSYMSTDPLADEISGLTATSIKNNGNIRLTTYNYIPMVGISQITFPDGTIESYTYNSSGKLLDVRVRAGNKTNSTYYSPDNKQ